MSREQAHTLIGPYVLDALEGADRRAVERHLARCPACAQEASQLRAATGALAAAAAASPPPPLRAAVLAAVDRTPQLPPVVSLSGRAVRLRWRPSGSDERGARPALPTDLTPTAGSTPTASSTPTAGSTPTVSSTPTRPAGPGRRSAAPARRARVAVGVAAGLVLAAVAALGGLTIDQHQQLTAARARDAESRAAARTAALGAAHPLTGGGKLAVVSTGGRALVVTRDLPALPGGRTYQLWFVGTNAVRSAGLADGQGGNLDRFLTVPADATTLAVTSEPAGGSKAPTTPPLGSAPLRA